ncbi:hypothetical protein BJ322DRAFT_1179670 [Thelephora terrestris]|uniref:Uncharacterized protein n=1 Tax=Thelephora terrestris TaxID=56493 RepID=A0A9P6H2G9_9AGAM|nr:hypothetical protein BJ322DRAFT_1179670 [Thelephora terrestris]
MSSSSIFPNTPGGGFVCAVAYFDPGNWGVDLQAGIGIWIQTPFHHLASHCRLLLYNRPKHTLLYRWLVLYPLYLLGSAMGLVMLFRDSHRRYWGQAFLGYVPSKNVFQAGSLYTSIGVIGATVMPHSLFLGSALATQIGSLNLFHKSVNNRYPKSCQTTKARRQRNNSFDLWNRTYTTEVVDIVLSLLGVAVVITQCGILILSSALYFTMDRKVPRRLSNPASLFDAHDLLSRYGWQTCCVLFAVALLFSVRVRRLSRLLAGQIPFIRRITMLLVASQVVLSIVLPFVNVPLLWLTTSKKIMSVKKPESDLTTLTPAGSPQVPTCQSAKHRKPVSQPNTTSKASPDGPTEMVDYSNGKIVASIGYLVWAGIIVANVYVIVMLALGKSG